MLERDQERLKTAHGEAGHGPVVAIRHGAIRPVDHGDQVLDHHLLEGGERFAEVAERRTFLPRGRLLRRHGGRVARPARIATLHHHEHGLRLPFGNQIIHDEANVPLVHPAPFVFTAAVLQIQHRITSFPVDVIVRWSVHEDASPFLGRLGVIPALPDFAVWHIFGAIEIDSLLRNLDAAGLLAGPVERFAGWVTDLHAIDNKHIVMEPRHLRLRGRGPETILVLLRRIGRAADKLECDLLGVRRLDTERHSQVGMMRG